jgi:hypothetical protein
MIRLKETEHDKINNELLNKLVPVQALNDYYYFGFAEALIFMKRNIERCKFIDNELCDRLIQIFDGVGNNDEVKELYNRLNK